jgi:hypothetical protein
MRQGRILAGLSDDEVASAFSILRRLSDNVRAKAPREETEES